MGSFLAGGLTDDETSFLFLTAEAFLFSRVFIATASPTATLVQKKKRGNGTCVWKACRHSQAKKQKHTHEVQRGPSAKLVLSRSLATFSSRGLLRLFLGIAATSGLEDVRKVKYGQT